MTVEHRVSSTLVEQTGLAVGATATWRLAQTPRGTRMVPKWLTICIHLLSDSLGTDQEGVFWVYPALGKSFPSTNYGTQRPIWTTALAQEVVGSPTNIAFDLPRVHSEIDLTKRRMPDLVSRGTRSNERVGISLAVFNDDASSALNYKITAVLEWDMVYLDSGKASDTDDQQDEEENQF